jgi:hypothetical protein
MSPAGRNMVCVLLMLAMMGSLPALIHYSYSRSSMSNLNLVSSSSSSPMSPVVANAAQPLVVKTHQAIWERYEKIYANTSAEERYSVHPFEPGRIPYDDVHLPIFISISSISRLSHLSLISLTAPLRVRELTFSHYVCALC